VEVGQCNAFAHLEGINELVVLVDVHSHGQQRCAPLQWQCTHLASRAISQSVPGSQTTPGAQILGVIYMGEAERRWCIHASRHGAPAREGPAESAHVGAVAHVARKVGGGCSIDANHLQTTSGRWKGADGVSIHDIDSF